MEHSPIHHLFADCGGRLVAVRDFDRTAHSEPVCPACSGQLIAMQGEKWQWHFRHKSGLSCDPVKYEHACAVRRICDVLRAAQAGDGPAPRIVNHVRLEAYLQALLARDYKLKRNCRLPGEGEGRVDIALLQDKVPMLVIDVHHPHQHGPACQTECPWVELDAIDLLGEGYEWHALNPATHERLRPGEGTGKVICADNPSRWWEHPLIVGVGLLAAAGLVLLVGQSRRR